MDPSSHTFQVSADVTQAMKTKNIPFGNYNQTFSGDLKMPLGAFEELLKLIQQIVNDDPVLPKLHPFDYSKIDGFVTYYFPRSIATLIWGIDDNISHNPSLV